MRRGEKSHAPVCRARLWRRCACGRHCVQRETHWAAARSACFRGHRAHLAADAPAPAASAPSGVLVPAAPVLLAALTAGQRTVIPVAPLIAPPGVVLASTREIAQLLDWRPHLFDFESTPLAEGVETFNRRNSLHLVIGDDDLRALPIVASFRSDTAEGFVRLIEGTMGVAPPAGLPRLAVSRLHRKAGANLFGPRLNHPSDPIPQTRGPLMAERTSRIVPSQKAPYFAQRDVQRCTQRSPRHNH